jgi:hypothetical protein
MIEFLDGANEPLTESSKNLEVEKQKQPYFWKVLQKDSQLCLHTGIHRWD